MQVKGSLRAKCSKLSCGIINLLLVYFGWDIVAVDYDAYLFYYMEDFGIR